MTATSELRATILLVEDDPALTMLLIDRLGAEGYSVHKAASAAQAVELTAQISPDLILLDLSLPDQHGLVLCAELKEKHEAPIIICSGTKHEHEAILALKLGADDFVAKPFSVDELAARIEVVLRRTRPPTGPELDGLEDIERVGELVIDRAGYVITVCDEPLKLTPTEYRLLCTLAHRPDQVLSRQELTEALWGYYDVGVSRSLDVHIRRLRAKLKACAGDAPDIVTVRGFGFKITCNPQRQTENGRFQEAPISPWAADKIRLGAGCANLASSPHSPVVALRVRQSVRRASPPGVGRLTRSWKHDDAPDGTDRGCWHSPFRRARAIVTASRAAIKKRFPGCQRPEPLYSISFESHNPGVATIVRVRTVAGLVCMRSVTDEERQKFDE